MTHTNTRSKFTNLKYSYPSFSPAESLRTFSISPSIENVFENNNNGNKRHGRKWSNFLLFQLFREGKFQKTIESLNLLLLG